jgi:hypothetical protein
MRRRSQTRRIGDCAHRVPHSGEPWTGTAL